MTTQGGSFFDNFSLPSRNQIFSAGLGLLGTGDLSGGLRGIEQGRLQDRQDRADRREDTRFRREESRLQAEEDRRKALQSFVAANSAAGGANIDPGALRSAVRPDSPALGAPSGGSFLQGTIDRIAGRNSAPGIAGGTVQGGGQGIAPQGNVPDSLKGPNKLMLDLLRRQLDRGQPLPLASGPNFQGAGPQSRVAAGLSPQARIMQQALGGASGGPTNLAGALQTAALPGALPAVPQGAGPQAPLAPQAAQTLTQQGAAPQAPLFSEQDVALLATMPPAQQGQFIAGKIAQQGQPRATYTDGQGFERYSDTNRRVNPDLKKSTSLQQNAEFLGIDPSDPRLAEKFLSSGGTTVNVGDNGVQYPTPPPGFGYRRDQQGQVIVGNEGVPSLLPIPGGPAEAKRARDVAKEAAAVEGAAAARRGETQTADVVLREIGRVKDLAKESFLPTTGIGGGALSSVPGTAAFDTSKLLDTIKANVGFSQLQKMRNASSTGGALGQISERENLLLQSVLGSLEQAQSQDQFFETLDDLEKTFLDIVHGPGNRPGAQGSSQGEPSQEDLEFTAQEEGITVDEVRRRLGLQ